MAGQTAATAPVAVNPELVNLLNGFIAGSRSSAAAGVGALTLVLIVLQLFTSIENSFNEIWGVRRGRTWLMRIVFYWTVLTLGSLLFFAAVTMLSAGTFLNVFKEKLPFGTELMALPRWMVPSFSVVLLISILTVFYRFIPNTHVFWRAAFIGAVVVAALIRAQPVSRVLLFQARVADQEPLRLAGILPILMLGLFISGSSCLSADRSATPCKTSTIETARPRGAA